MSLTIIEDNEGLAYAKCNKGKGMDISHPMLVESAKPYEGENIITVCVEV